MKYYTGIGSRSTPATILTLMTALGEHFAKEGFTLRSGGAEGADSAFEMGAIAARVPSDIYLPWRDFNKHPSPLFEITTEALALAEKYHPAWDKCSQGAKRLHARNMYQILGIDLHNPSAFVVCWTPQGSGSGGTGQALRVAKDANIPIFDLGNDAILEDLQRLLKPF